jgi:hypothetical protein
VRSSAALALLLVAVPAQAQQTEQPQAAEQPQAQQQDPNRQASATDTAPAAAPAAPPASQTPPAAQATAPSPSPQAAAPATGAQPPAAAPATQPQTAQAAALPPTSPPAAAPSAAEATSTRTPSDQASHALSRTLVEQGGLLLEPGRFELVPEVSFALSDQDQMLTSDGTGVEAQTRRFTGTMTLRLGLPFRLQAEGELPLVWARQDAVANGPPAATETGLGDFRGALTLHLYKGSGGAPDVLVDAFWKTRTGRTPLDVDDPAAVPLGTGTQQAGGGVSVVKAVDPVVLLASVSLGSGIPRRLHAGWLDTGPELGITTSAVLAVSPETSMSFGLEQSYSGDVKLAGKSLASTGHTAAVFDVGFATLVSRAALFQITLGIGLTSDVPRFQVSMGLPLAF